MAIGLKAVEFSRPKALNQKLQLNACQVTNSLFNGYIAIISITVCQKNEFIRWILHLLVHITIPLQSQTLMPTTFLLLF